MADMLIEALHAKNARLFTELNIRFNDQFNVLTGANGCGKTSALACIAHCFSGHFEYSRFGEGAELWVDIQKDSEAYRIGLGPGSFNANKYRSISIKGWDPPPVDGFQRISRSAHQEHKELQSSPLFLGSRRNFTYQYIEGFRREKDREEALEEYLSKGIPSLYGEWETNIKQWLVNREFMIEKEWAAQERQNWERFTGSLPKIAPYDSHFSYVKMDRDLEAVFSVYGKECYLAELSAGFQSVLSLIINIFIWIESTMEGDRRLAVNAKGTVLIDDLDIHLRPEWQYTIREALIDLFPNLQFIVTTNSPYLLASAGPGEVIIIPTNHTGEAYHLSPQSDFFADLRTEDILMKMRRAENHGLAQKIRPISVDESKIGKIKNRSDLIEEAYTHSAGGNIPGLKAALHSLKALCPADDAVVRELELKLESCHPLSKEARRERLDYFQKRMQEAENFLAGNPEVDAEEKLTIYREKTREVMSEMREIPEDNLDYDVTMLLVKGYTIVDNTKEALALLFSNEEGGKNDPLWYYYAGYCFHFQPEETNPNAAAAYFTQFLKMANEKNIRLVH